MIKISYPDSLKSIYYKDIANRRFRNRGNKTLEQIYIDEFQNLIGVDLKILLCGEYDKLPKIELSSEDKNRIKEVFNYQDKFQKHISNIFKKHIEVHTCYYCNIDFINIFKTTKKNFLTGYTLDHIINKADYPYLALSLYNLIPTCYICNSKLKKEHSIGNNVPTSTNFDFDQKVKFKTFIENKNLQIKDIKDFNLLLKEDFTTDYEQYINTLKLNERYEYHKYKVLELMEKRKAYPDSRIKELALISQKTEEEVKQDIFGEYLENELHKRPLSKLIKDITQELGL
jgi:5-methylcytosine-specific restriction endonuclease McrA